MEQRPAPKSPPPPLADTHCSELGRACRSNGRGPDLCCCPVLVCCTPSCLLHIFRVFCLLSELASPQSGLSLSLSVGSVLIW